MADIKSEGASRHYDLCWSDPNGIYGYSKQLELKLPREDIAMQYMVSYIDRTWDASGFNTEEEALAKANKLAQQELGRAVGIYKIDRIFKTESMPIEDIKVDTIHGDIVKYLQDLTGKKNDDSESECIFSERD